MNLRTRHPIYHPSFNPKQRLNKTIHHHGYAKKEKAILKKIADFKSEDILDMDGYVFDRGIDKEYLNDKMKRREERKRENRIPPTHRVIQKGKEGGKRERGGMDTFDFAKYDEPSLLDRSLILNLGKMERSMRKEREALMREERNDDMEDQEKGDENAKREMAGVGDVSDTGEMTGNVSSEFIDEFEQILPKDHVDEEQGDEEGLSVNNLGNEFYGKVEKLKSSSHVENKINPKESPQVYKKNFKDENRKNFESEHTLDAHFHRATLETFPFLKDLYEKRDDLTPEENRERFMENWMNIKNNFAQLKQQYPEALGTKPTKDIKEIDDLLLSHRSKITLPKEVGSLNQSLFEYTFSRSVNMENFQERFLEHKYNEFWSSGVWEGATFRITTKTMSPKQYENYRKEYTDLKKYTPKEKYYQPSPFHFLSEDELDKLLNQEPKKKKGKRTRIDKLKTKHSKIYKAKFTLQKKREKKKQLRIKKYAKKKKLD